MKIKTVDISNYKLIEQIDFPLTDGINIFIGANNSGKTSLLEAMSFSFGINQNRFHGMAIMYSRCVVKFHVNLAELQTSGIRSFYVNTDHVYDDFDQMAGAVFSKLGKLEVDVVVNKTLMANYGYQSLAIVKDLCGVPIRQNTLTTNSQNKSFMFSVKSTGLHKEEQGESHTDMNQYISSKIETDVYFISYSRTPPSIGNAGTKDRLNSNFDNLPEVLNNLRTRHGLWTRLCEMLNYIVPSVARYTTISREDGQVEILIWESGVDDTYVNFGVPLKDAGAGIAQILGILYVLVTSIEEKIIIIDEIGNFLHPLATRRLMEIIRQSRIHQYVISTHSSEIINGDYADQVYFVTKKLGKMSIDILNTADYREMQALLGNIGSSISEIYGSNKILWVEGPTEELAFRAICKVLHGNIPLNILFLGVIHTGDFERPSRDPKTIYDIYIRLSTGNAFIPKAVGFLFDRENRSNTQVEDLNRRSGGKLKFTKRRLFECYLLHIPSISGLLAGILDRNKMEVESEVILWLSENHNLKKYISDYSVNLQHILNEDWLSRVDAANLLKDLFASISENKLEYRKKIHSVELTEMILKENPQYFEDIGGMIRDFLKAEDDFS